MPELPEIESIKRVIEPQIQGLAIDRVTVNRPEVIANPDAAEFCGRVSGQSFAGMERRGKFLIFSLESGVGGAVFFGGSPYNGDNLRSGEFGHMCVEPAGLPCKCGKRGCLEAYSSVLRIKNTLGVTLEEFAQGLSAHNPDYELLLHDMLRHLAIGIDNIRMALDCDVILGGLLTEYLAPYMQQLQEYARAYNIFGDSADYIHLSSLRQHSVSLGAALHFIQNFIRIFYLIHSIKFSVIR